MYTPGYDKLQKTSTNHVDLTMTPFYSSSAQTQKMQHSEMSSLIT